MESRINLIGKTRIELEKLLVDWGQPAFRAQQLFNWIYNKRVLSFAKMNNLPQDLQEELANKASLATMEVVKNQASSDGTTKYLFSLVDDSKVEAVYMPYRDGRRSLCLSTQAGCAMGCDFCATGLQGFDRDLTAGEILEQLLLIEAETGEQVTNIVLMGMGEPLDNYDAVLKAIRLLNHQAGLNIGMRRITLSTCGLIPEIKRLAEERLQLTLAVSLHAVDDERRDKLIPINKKYPIADLLDACRYYIEQTSRRITFEYALIEGVNDSRDDAEKLSNLLTGMLAHVNLIPVNKVGDGVYKQSEWKKLKRFARILKKNDISTTIRVERGADIDAACGQLKAGEEE